MWLGLNVADMGERGLQSRARKRQRVVFEEGKNVLRFQSQEGGGKPVLLRPLPGRKKVVVKNILKK